MSIGYILGDATQPIGTDPRVIVHVCNDMGRWGKGFVIAISRRWRQPKERFQAWFRDGVAADGTPFMLGQVQFVEVEPQLWIANLIGQHRVRRGLSHKPIRYEAVREGLHKVRVFAQEHGASLHMPRIGCGLAGGQWEKIEPILQETLSAHGLPVTVYDLPMAPSPGRLTPRVDT